MQERYADFSAHIIISVAIDNGLNYVLEGRSLDVVDAVDVVDQDAHVHRKVPADFSHRRIPGEVSDSHRTQNPKRLTVQARRCKRTRVVSAILPKNSAYKIFLVTIAPSTVDAMASYGKFLTPAYLAL